MECYNSIESLTNLINLHARAYLTLFATRYLHLVRHQSSILRGASSSPLARPGAASAPWADTLGDSLGREHAVLAGVHALQHQGVVEKGHGAVAGLEVERVLAAKQCGAGSNSGAGQPAECTFA